MKRKKKKEIACISSDHGVAIPSYDCLSQDIFYMRGVNMFLSEAHLFLELISQPVNLKANNDIMLYKLNN